LTGVFIGNQGVILVFRGFDGLPSISGFKIMAKILQIN